MCNILNLITVDDLKSLMEKPLNLRADSNKKESYSDRWLPVNHPQCSGFLRKISFDQFVIGRAKLKTHRAFKRPFEIKEHRVLLYFILEGSPTAESEFFPQLTFKAGTHNIVYLNPLQGVAQADGGSYEMFFVSMPLSLFKNYFPKHKRTFACFTRKMEREQFSLLRQEHGVINHQIYKIIEDVCQCEQDKDLKKIYIKAKIIELLSLQLGQLCEQCSPHCPLKKEHVEKMYAVRDFILEHVGEYHSLKSLAKRVGTNEYTLKREFKELFGATVFGFWYNMKMEKGQRLLMERELSIKQISETVGYKNPQHFSTAFKKKFGMAPSIFQKNIDWQIDSKTNKRTDKK